MDRDRLPMTGELTALLFRAEGLPRARRADPTALAQQSAGFVARQLDQRLAALARQRRQATTRAEALDLTLQAVRTEHAARVYTRHYIAGHLRDLLRAHPQAEHCAGGACGPNVITTVGKAWLVDAWQNIVEPETMKYHGPGTGTTAAAAGDINLQTPCTTALNPDNTRATGSLGELSAGVFRTVGTCLFDAITAVTEWGLFSQAATSGGVMFARNTFAALNPGVGDSIVFTWDWTA